MLPISGISDAHLISYQPMVYSSHFYGNQLPTMQPDSSMSLLPSLNLFCFYQVGLLQATDTVQPYQNMHKSKRAKELMHIGILASPQGEAVNLYSSVMFPEWTHFTQQLAGLSRTEPTENQLSNTALD